MPYYLCRMASEDGRISRRSASAASAADCRRRFESEGFCVLSVRRDWRKLNLSLGGDHKLKDRDFIIFNQELAALVRAGYPVLRSVEVISGRTKNAVLTDILKRVESEIRQGKSLSEAFAPFEDRFSKIYIAALMAGETSGGLAETVGQYILYAKIIAQTQDPGPRGPDLPDHAAAVLLRAPDHHPELRPAEFRRLLLPTSTPSSPC